MHHSKPISQALLPYTLHGKRAYIHLGRYSYEETWEVKRISTKKLYGEELTPAKELFIEDPIAEATQEAFLSLQSSKSDNRGIIQHPNWGTLTQQGSDFVSYHQTIDHINSEDYEENDIDPDLPSCMR